MPLADRSSVITVGLKNLRDGSRARRPVRAVAWPTADQLGDRAESHRVMVPPRQQGRARGRTKRRHVKSIVTKSLRRKFVERRRSDGPAERGRITEASIVNQHEENVRRIRWSFHWLSKRPLQILPACVCAMPSNGWAGRGSTVLSHSAFAATDPGIALRLQSAVTIRHTIGLGITVLVTLCICRPRGWSRKEYFRLVRVMVDYRPNECALQLTGPDEQQSISLND